MDGTLIASLIGVVTTFVSGFTSYLFARRKYNAEVDNQTVRNVADSLKVYKDIVADLEDKIDAYIEVAETNRVEVIRLKGIIHRMINKICTDGTCTSRIPYTTEEVKEILGMLDEPVESVRDRIERKRGKRKNETGTVQG